MSTWQPPWSAQGQFHGDATVAHPSKQLGHGQATSRARIDGRAARGLAGTPAPLDLLADLGWPGGQPTTRQPRWPEPFGPRPASPAPTVSTSTTRREDPAGITRPDATTATPTAGYGEARESLPAWVGEQSEHGCADAKWQTPRRRRRTGGARLRRNPNLRRGRRHYSALPVQPRSTLRDPPRLGPAGDDPHEATPLLSCRGRWSAQHGGASTWSPMPVRPATYTTRQDATHDAPDDSTGPSGANATDHAPHGNKADP